MNLTISKLIIVFVVLVLTACASTSKPLVKKAPQITIYNFTSSPIFKILAVNCTDREKFRGTLYAGDLLAENIRSGEGIIINYRAQCVDITAYSKDGRVVGRQSSVSIPPSLVWHIRS